MMHFALFIFLFFPQICGLTFLVQWRGEKDFAYSPRELREAEFRNALSATLTSPLQLSPQLAFETVMEGSEQPNQTNQNDIIQLVHTDVDPATIVAGASRCATVRHLYQIIGNGASYSSCAASASLELGCITEEEKIEGSWAVRCRDYRHGRVGKAVNVGKTFEREAIVGIEEVTRHLLGPVKLKSPEILLYVCIFPGSRYLLMRELGHGYPNLRAFDPNTRKCVTSTPLEPIAAFVMANCGRVRPGSRVIDLYAGSCATLLAAGGLCPDVRTVGIERDNNWLVPFDKILEDFEIRDLPLPTLVRGDSRDHTIIEQILDEPYDVVLADPPYGKRERKDNDAAEPLFDIVSTLAKYPLLKPGGRLCVFVPVETDLFGLQSDEVLKSLSITQSLLESANLELCELVAQRLNAHISRLLLVFEKEKES